MCNNRPCIAVVGGPALDWIARVPYVPPPDGNVVATEVLRAPGGLGANVAVALARLGHRVRLLGATGDDEAGRWLRQILAQAGVETDALLVRPGVPTYGCFIAVTPIGERLIFGLPGAAVLERDAELDRAAVRQARAVHIVQGYSEVAWAAVEEARAAGSLVSYAPGDVRWANGPAAVREVARHVDLLVVNRVEAAALTGEDDPAVALRRLLDSGPRCTVVTAGVAGAWVGQGTQITLVPAFPVPATDTTGAGDAFTAGLLTGLLAGRSPEEAARLGAAVAALKLRAPGAQAGLPTIEEALAFESSTFPSLEVSCELAES